MIELVNNCSGSFGHLSSAATVAASSFEMKLTDPDKLLAAIDQRLWKELRGIDGKSVKSPSGLAFRYVEPNCAGSSSVGKPNADAQKPVAFSTTPPVAAPTAKTLRGKIQQLGDFIDTDAVGWR